MGCFGGNFGGGGLVGIFFFFFNSMSLSLSGASEASGRLGFPSLALPAGSGTCCPAAASGALPGLPADPAARAGPPAPGVPRVTRKLRGAGERVRLHPPACPAAAANQRGAQSDAVHGGSRSPRLAGAVWRRAVPRPGDVASVT